MAHKASTRDFNPDKKFLQNICKKATSQADGARLCGVSTKTFIRRMKEAKLSRELKELTKKGRSLGRKAWDPTTDGSVVKGKQVAKKKIKKKDEPSPLLEAAKALHEKKVVKPPVPIIKRKSTNLLPEDEVDAIREELSSAHKEKAVIPPSKEEQDKDFVNDLAQKLAILDSGDIEIQTTGDMKIEVKEQPMKKSSKRKRYLPLLAKIAEIIIDECDD